MERALFSSELPGEVLCLILQTVAPRLSPWRLDILRLDILWLWTHMFLLMVIIFKPFFLSVKVALHWMLKTQTPIIPKNNKESFLFWPRVLSGFPCEYNVLYCHSDIVILCLTRPAITGNGNLLRYGQLPNDIVLFHGLPCGYYGDA